MLRSLTVDAQGTLPSCLGSMPALTTFDVSYNAIEGPLPASLAHAQQLEQFDASFNVLSGPLPDLSGLARLRSLWLANNALSGSVRCAPSRCCPCVLTAAGRRQIPSSLARASALQSLWLSFNRLDGVIPSQLGALSDLQTLWLYSNHLSGSIPSQVFFVLLDFCATSFSFL